MRTTTLSLFNTASRTAEEFTANDNRVRLYTCGPTVYDYPHIGNWVAYIYWDTLVRVLRVEGYAVERVMNITDVGHLVSDEDEGEDKLEKGARREGKTAWEVAAFYTEDFMQGMNKLGLLTPEHIARATDYIDEQLALVRVLKEKGFTYQISDGIYFDTAKFPRYGDFARLNTDELKAGARVEFNPEKRHTSDFALWKFTPAGTKRDMEWETPEDLIDFNQSAPSESEEKDGSKNTVMGFPGWHLECSAIAMKFLGSTLDIHTGGIDHIPVHHTNEIAQSEAATDQRFSRFWLHNNHMKVEGSKISKSLGNGYTLQDLEQRGFDPLDFRMLVLQSHYQSEANFSFEALEAAQNRRYHWRNVACLRWQISEELEEDSALSDAIRTSASKIAHTLYDNLNTPEALKIIDEILGSIENHDLTTVSKPGFVTLLHTLDALFGLNLVGSTPDIDDTAKQLIAERQIARDNKDWANSDRLRSELSNRSIIVNDTPSGTIWSYAK